MKRLILLTAILLCCASGARAQGAMCHTFELGVGGVRINPSLLSGDSLFADSSALSMYAEYRWGITNWLAVGTQMDVKLSSGDLIRNIQELYGIYNNLRYYQGGLKVLVEFKLFARHKVKPFVSVLAGPGLGRYKLDLEDPFASLLSCDLSPRIGLQLGHNFRASAQFSFSPSLSDTGLSTIVNGNFTSLGINLGWAF